MLKAKKYDWKDSNMALFGSDTEKGVKKESAESEPAWQGSGQEPGLRIWRIVKFKVESWPKEDYGKFYSGDSYIILNTYKNPDSDELLYDVHFWIGKYSTQDEYGTAAYKTVELDTFHDDKPVQHREVQGHESKLFRSYFDTLTLLEGGADTGFRRVTPEAYKPRLLKFRKEGRKVEMTEVKLKRSNLNEGDVFILDQGLQLYQWNGSACSKDEKFRATQEMQQICSERGGRPRKETLDQGDISDNHRFYDNFADDDDDEDDEPDVMPEGEAILKKVSDADGSLDLEDVKEGEFSTDDLCTDDVYLIDTKKELFIWVGNGASVDERHNAMSYAHKYLQTTDYPFLAITVVTEANQSQSEGFKSVVPGCA
ncbi:gelsolin-like protein 1 isoform X2 [Mercenaria mercenaria]|nr:gelsolin-like protein 1 isoform X2 [Mercenaria mercenaria]XP_045166594.2 gelsolin-like protein 1 isoform X2 [Mercenaria mercenaria]